jgi:hypothetical protein
MHGGSATLDRDQDLCLIQDKAHGTHTLPTLPYLSRTSLAPCTYVLSKHPQNNRGCECVEALLTLTNRQESQSNAEEGGAHAARGTHAHWSLLPLSSVLPPTPPILPCSHASHASCASLIIRKPFFQQVQTRSGGCGPIRCLYQRQLWLPLRSGRRLARKRLGESLEPSLFFAL